MGRKSRISRLRLRALSGLSGGSGVKNVPVQETWAQTLAQEGPPCRRTAKPMSRSCRSPRAREPALRSSEKPAHHS